MKITLFLAQILDTFKTKNPKIFVIICIALTFAFGGLTQLVETNAAMLPEWVENALKYIGIIVAFLVNSGTHQVKEDAKKLLK